MKDDELWDEYFGHYSKRTLIEFFDFHNDNPHIYSKFKKLSVELLKSGVNRYSSKTIICVMRYDHTIKTNGKPYKISDKYQSIYGRWLAYNDRRFKDFFQFKIRRPYVTREIEQFKR